MKILSLTNCPLDPASGAGKAVLRYTQGLRNLGHTVDVIEPDDYEPRFIFNRGRQYRQAWGAWNFIRQKLQNNSYDLIEFYGGEFWLAARYLSKWQKRPLLVHHTNGVELLNRECQRIYDPPNSFIAWIRDKFSREIHAYLARMAFVYTDAFVCMCEIDRKYVLDLGFYLPERTAVVRHGIDEEYRSMPFLTNKEERIAYIGTWIPRKGIRYLCKVMTKILKQNSKLRFDIYSSGGFQKILNNFPPELHSRITIFSYLSNRDMANHLAKAKVFFFPSQYEGFGLALAEAMACSCAAVTTRTGFGAELKDKEEALLCDFDDFKTMEYSIQQLLQNETLRLKIAYAGWRKSQLLNWDVSTKNLEIIYKNWLNEYYRKRPFHIRGDSNIQ